MLAAENGHTDTVKELLSSGADVNQIDKVSNKIITCIRLHVCHCTVYNTEKICHTHSPMHVCTVSVQ